MSIERVQALPIEQLRRRASVKWRAYGDDVLPLFVAETDYPLAPAVRRALADAVELGDTGYTPGDPEIRAAFAEFAERRYGWRPDLEGIATTGDVMMGVVEILRLVTRPGDRVIITPPVYPPFSICIPEAGAVVESVPLRNAESGYELDLDGIEAAFAAGAKAMLLCSPHNPTGTVHPASDLARLAEIAVKYGAVIVSDEIHAPLAPREAGFTPFLAVSPAARQVGYAVTSASKAFNLAGLKCALILTADPSRHRSVRQLPPEVFWRTGLFGALAGAAAFGPESDPWLDAVQATIADSHRLLGSLLAAHLPEARFEIPPAGYLAWVDLSGLEWGPDPARRILREAKVALHRGSEFGAGGEGYARFVVACSPAVLTEAVMRIAAIRR